MRVSRRRANVPAVVLTAAGLIAAGLLVSGLAGCRPPATDSVPEISLAWTTSPAPPAVGPVTLTLTLEEGTTPVAGAEVRLEGTMTHPGMAPVSSTAKEASPGSYEARMDLSMAGDWIVLVDARLADGRTLKRQIELPGVRPDGRSG